METIIKKDSFCLELIAKKRLFTILNDQVQASRFFDESLHQALIDYTDKYIQYHNLEAKVVTKHYLSYIKSYNKDVRAFEETGKYPLAIDPERAAPDRIAYDTILLFSTFMTPHRFRIMQLIKEKSFAADKGLIIGCGPGLEIDLIQNKVKEAVAYDLSIAPFLPDFFQEKVVFKNEFFDGSGTEKYDSIYLIELLEHLSDPFELLENCKKVLATKGKIFLTTATDIPQFDHLYNFAADHKHFDKTILEMGFQIDYAEDIVHEAITKDVGAMNKFYILSLK